MSKTLHRECRSVAEHEREAFLLNGSLALGTWAEAGLIVEQGGDDYPGGLWKSMRCGCLFVAFPVWAQS